MREFVGVRSPLDLMIEVGSRRLPVDSVFKREALMFSRIAIPQLGKIVSAFEKIGTIAQPISNQFCAHVEYLKEHSVIFDDVSSAVGPEVGVLMSHDAFRGLAAVEWPIATAIFEGLKNAGLDKVLEGQDLTVDEMFDSVESRMEQLPFIVGPVICAFQLIVRKLSIQLRVLDKMDACPVFSDIVPPIPLEASERNAAVVDVVINALPVPDETVSWEQIIEFRSDPDSQSKFLALRNWMAEVARAELNPAEIELKLEHLIDQYRQHMKFHRMRANVGRFQTVLMAAANLLDRNFTEATRTLFSSKERTLNILEGELTSPGKEVAYIVSATERLGMSANHGNIK
jgi:hypothetical protein